MFKNTEDTIPELDNEPVISPLGEDEIFKKPKKTDRTAILKKNEIVKKKKRKCSEKQLEHLRRMREKRANNLKKKRGEVITEKKVSIQAPTEVRAENVKTEIIKTPKVEPIIYPDSDKPKKSVKQSVKKSVKKNNPADPYSHYNLNYTEIVKHAMTLHHNTRYSKNNNISNNNNKINKNVKLNKNKSPPAISKNVVKHSPSVKGIRFKRNKGNNYQNNLFGDMFN